MAIEIGKWDNKRPTKKCHTQKSLNMYLNQSAAVSTTAKRGEVHLVQLPQGQTQAVDVGWNCRPLRKIKVRGNNLVSARANLRFTQVRDSKLSLSRCIKSAGYSKNNNIIHKKVPQTETVQKRSYSSVYGVCNIISILTFFILSHWRIRFKTAPWIIIVHKV